MGIPFRQVVSVGAYVVRQHLAGRKRYPLVLMLEPLFQCNLACAGCGKIDYPDPILSQRISVRDALDSVDECGAPVVVMAGGEPLLHKDLPEIVRGVIARRKFAIVCTNALLLQKKIDQYQPGPYFTWSIHLDRCANRGCTTGPSPPCRPRKPRVSASPSTARSSTTPIPSEPPRSSTR
jgi:hopanoid biosynthesis associated radical SAM protein HpnH